MLIQTFLQVWLKQVDQETEVAINLRKNLENKYKIDCKDKIFKK